eukprot:3644269-Pleurochrysis_carterae.AAC.3
MVRLQPFKRVRRGDTLDPLKQPAKALVLVAHDRRVHLPRFRRRQVRKGAHRLNTRFVPLVRLMQREPHERLVLRHLLPHHEIQRCVVHRTPADRWRRPRPRTVLVEAVGGPRRRVVYRPAAEVPLAKMRRRVATAFECGGEARRFRVEPVWHLTLTVLVRLSKLLVNAEPSWVLARKSGGARRTTDGRRDREVHKLSRFRPELVQVWSAQPRVRAR